MANVVIFNEAGSPQNVLAYLRSVHTPDFKARSDVLINPDLSQVAGLEYYYWKHVAGSVVPMTAQEQADLDAAEAAAIVARDRAIAEQLHDVTSGEGRALRALVKVVVAELNALRTQWRDFQTETAAATSLANFQARVATLPSLEDRTYQQARTSIGNEIQGE